LVAPLASRSLTAVLSGAVAPSGVAGMVPVVSVLGVVVDDVGGVVVGVVVV
jgi:hypothetical protein